MIVRFRSRLPLVFWIVSTVAIGLLSRVVHTGSLIFDKYLGDALYAVMVYLILRLILRATASAVYAMFVMTIIELFQLTMIPAHMLASQHSITRICARLLGVEFSVVDLLAYGAGVVCIYFVDSSRSKGEEESNG